eukprot:5579140-Prymnesium_polylepis.1
MSPAESWWGAAPRQIPNSTQRLSGFVCDSCMRLFCSTLHHSPPRRFNTFVGEGERPFPSRPTHLRQA